MKLFIPLFIVLLFSCSEDSDQSSKSKFTGPDQSEKYEYPKFNIKTPENKFTFSSDEEFVIVTKMNSRISVPKSAFQSKQGKEITGKVDLIFKEYHTQGEIIASKLPMVYTTPSGEKQDFESAGMFDIRAYQNGKELKLKADKSIQVELITTNSNKFNFYNLNEPDVVWALKETNCLPVKNKYKQAMQSELDSLNNLEELTPKKPIEYKEGDQLFDINIDYKHHEELEDLMGVMWKVTEKDSLKSAKISSKIFKRSFNFVRLEPTENDDLEFKLHFINGIDTLAFNAAPIFKGKLLSKQKQKFKDLIATIHKNVKRSNEIEDQLRREKELLRSFNVDQLGVYNYDYKFKDPLVVPILANFTFEGINSAIDLKDVSIYLIPSAEKVVIRYTQETLKSFNLNPSKNNKLIAILPNNDVYTLSSKEVHGLLLNKDYSKTIDFQMKKLKQEVIKVEQIDVLISKL